VLKGSNAPLTGDSYRDCMRQDRAPAGREALASCNDYLVEATDGRVGEVETPLFPSDGFEPDYLVLRVVGPSRVLRPVVTTALVESVDPRQRLVRLRVTKKLIRSLPEDLPVAN
jgi:hypothetical protein